MQPHPPRPWPLAIGGLIALAVAMGIGRFVYTPILPHMVDALGLSAAEAGFIASANFLGYLAGALLAATPWIRGSRRTWLVAALALSAVTTLATGAFASGIGLGLMRFLGGLASAFVLVFASSVILERLAQAGASGLAAVHFAGVGTGIALSAALVSALAASGQPWTMQWFASGAVALLGALLVALLVPPDAPSSGTAPQPPGIAWSPRLAALVAAYGLFGFGYVITATFLVAIVRGAPEIRHLEPVVWVLFGLAAVPSVVLWNAVGRRIGIYAAFAAACLVEAVGVAASVLATNTAGVVVASLFLGGTFMAITALGLVGARTLTASDPRRVIALMTGAFGAGQIVGPSLAGAMVDRTGTFVLPSLLAAGALVLAAILSAPLDRRA